MNYAELHNHTFYSKLDGLSSPAEFCIRANEVGIKWLADTNHGTMAGQREFQRACADAGINPIVGVEAYISPTDRFDKRAKGKRQDGTNVYNHIILLAKNDQGIIDLNRLSDIAWNEGFYDSPRIDFEVLDKYGDNLIVLSGCMGGLVASEILKENYDAAEEWVKKFKGRFDSDFYMEIQAHNPPVLNNKLLEYADQYEIKPVITGDCHFADPKDRIYEEIFLILGTNPKKNPAIDMPKAKKMDLLDRLNYLYPDRRMTFQHLDLYLESPANRYEVLKKTGIDRTDVFENTMDVTTKISDYTYRKGESTLPKFPGIDLYQEIRRLCEEGLFARGLAGKQEYIDRMEEELALIKEKNILVYFYILWDALRFCRRNNILYGMGRGSAAGSLVCYLLQITEVDPLKYNLLFWRFLDGGDARYVLDFPLA